MGAQLSGLLKPRSRGRQHHETEFTTEKALSDCTSSSNTNQRYEVCTLLENRGIQNAIWLEDLLALHGSNTAVWDLNLLVHSTSDAADFLASTGYKICAPDSGFDHVPEVSRNGIRLNKEGSSTHIRLLPAANWHYDLAEETEGNLPSVRAFVDSLMEIWLNITLQDYVDHLRNALYIGCLIYYCYALKDKNNVPFKSIEYATQLQPEHRELHYDIVSQNKRSENFTGTARHQYHARKYREIKQGIFIPTPYGSGAFRQELTTLAE